MGGSAIGEELGITLPSNGVRTVVLVGRSGNGKSATGNSILGRKAFRSRASSSGVASTCELQQTVMEDGQIINVIDTPGLFDFAGGSEFVGKEIVKCIEMAKDGIHAILVVFSVRSRFSQEEEAALCSLQTLFGDNIIRYMIIVFTGGDELEDNDETLEDYLGRECPQPLKELLTLCGNRRVLFNNKTKDELERVKKVQELLSLVDMVIAQNGGRPYSDERFTELQEGAMKLRNQQKEIESKLKETTTRLEKQLAEEQSARLKAEEVAQLAQMRSNDEILKLRENLEREQKEIEELRKQDGRRAWKETEELPKQEKSRSRCNIL